MVLNLADKVEVAIYDNDNKIRTLKKFEISENGNQIRIVSGGEGHFMPKFDTNSPLYFPSWKRYLLLGKRTWKPLYIVKNKASECVNFKTGETHGPNPEEKKKANLNLLATKIGKDNEYKIPWPLYLIIALQFVIIGILANMSGVFR